MKILSPKQVFLKTPFAKVFADTIQTPPVQEALDMAMLQLSYLQGQSQDMGNAAAQHFRLEGAKQYREILLTLSDPPTKAEVNRGDNLPFET